MEATNLRVKSQPLARWFGPYTGAARVGGNVQVTMTAAEDAGGPPSTAWIEECEPHRSPLPP